MTHKLRGSRIPGGGGELAPVLGALGHAGIRVLS